MNINGNIQSIKESILNEIDELHSLELSKDEFLPEELAVRMARFTSIINREIAIYINRKGKIIDISIGDSGTVALPGVEGRRDKSRLSGVRCVHTHPNGDSMLSAVDINSLISLKLDAMIAIGVKEERITGVSCALLIKNENGDFDNTEIYGPFAPDDKRLNVFFSIIAERDKTSGSYLYLNEDSGERAILVGLETGTGKILNNKTEGERSLDELEELAYTAGASVLQKVLQRKHIKDPAYFIGKGKVEELSLLRQALDVNLIIFDDELSGAQVRNIEDVAGVKVIDRTSLILDIFAQRARSREGKLQVELAQLKYRLPRLIGLGNQLSRLGGGIGTRGPGEKKLEVDRRHINRRISYLDAELKVISKRRGLAREGRKKNKIPVIALAGYTNAGKSTLMNKLCGADVFAENKLFATLDPTTRSLKLPDGREALMIDTVGFIRKLPHDLIDAFKSTLEEAVSADIIIHVVDASSEEIDSQISVVYDILSDLGALNKPVITALNKMDRVNGKVRIPVTGTTDRTFEISAITGSGLEELLDGIERLIPSDEEEIEALAPYNAGWVAPYIHQNGKIISEEYLEGGIKIKATIKKTAAEKIREYIV